jgi:hypothetical protein
MRRLHPIINGTRECNGCEQWLPISAFNKTKRSATGLDYRCRVCRQKAKVDIYHRKAIKVSDVRAMMTKLIDDMSFTYWRKD